MGRRSTYSQKIADDVCEQIANGKTLLRACKDNPGWPARTTILGWRHNNEAFSDTYARATKDRAHLWAEESIEIGDNCLVNCADFRWAGALVQAARVQIDTRKWACAVTNPEAYGNRAQPESDAQPLERLKNITRRPGPTSE